MWHIRTATDDEKAVRRTALDFFGLLAVFASVVAGAAVCAFTTAYRANFTGDGWRRVYLADWWLGRRRRRWVFGTVFVAVAGLMVTLGTGDDYFHLTKRLSHTAAALLPAQYILSSRFILQRTAVLTHQTHETLNAAHRFLGRAIYTLICLHAALYLSYFARYRPDRLFYQDAIFGLIGLGFMTAIFVTSLPAYRRRFYSRFLGIHQLLTILLLPVVWFHVPYVRRYVLAAGAIIGIDRVGRYLTTARARLRVTYISSTALDVREDEPDQQMPITAPGSHYYVYVPGMPGSRGNPFTLAGGTHTRFLVRVRNGFTRALAESADSTVAALLEGPYGVAEVFPSQEEEEERELRFVWAVRDVQDAAWPLDELLKAGSTRINITVDIYITRFTNPNTNGPTDTNTTGDGGAGGPSDGVEMDELGVKEDEHLLADERGESSVGTNKRDMQAAIESLRRLYAHTPVTAHIRLGRPDVSRIAGDFCVNARGEKVAVMACGPAGMAGDVRRGIYACGGHREALVWLWEEQFSL
ncbi:hypothetical protein ABW21_db0205683 [Orbilia brochopaga]|nr:hypothetical protein ABW21_db0205683 [Drechslerella brochopaga]